MLRSTLILLATVALSLPAAAQGDTTVPLELIQLDLFKLDEATEGPLPGTHRGIALGSAIRFEVLAPRSGDLMVFAALLDSGGNPLMNTVVPLWSAVLIEDDTASLDIIIPLGFPEIDIGVQAFFAEGAVSTYASGLHRLEMFSTFD